jgi:hypothetical protein
MEVQQKMFKSGASLAPDNGAAPLSGPADLVLVFGSCARLAPAARIVAGAYLSSDRRLFDGGRDIR